MSIFLQCQYIQYLKLDAQVHIQSEREHVVLSHKATPDHECWLREETSQT